MIKIVAYDPSWPQAFAAIGRQLRNALGRQALSIHHIGSTSVPGLDAKDVIDIQITVPSLDIPIQEPLEKAGFVLSAVAKDHQPPGLPALDEDELTKKFYSRPAADPSATVNPSATGTAMAGTPRQRVHLHIRREGKFNQRYPLLCRDYLRTHPLVAGAYAEIKRQLACYFPQDPDAYYAIKDPVFDAFMGGAYEWATYTHWVPGASDA